LMVSMNIIKIQVPTGHFIFKSKALFKN
jgi:hypothetical protein